jgi:hypothetical protein
MVSSLEEARNFDKLPKRFFELMSTLGTSNDLETIYKTATELWENCLQLAKANSINIKSYSSLNEIRL